MPVPVSMPVPVHHVPVHRAYHYAPYLAAGIWAGLLRAILVCPVGRLMAELFCSWFLGTRFDVGRFWVLASVSVPLLPMPTDMLLCT